jgi:hypothetical protein
MSSGLQRSFAESSGLAEYERFIVREVAVELDDLSSASRIDSQVRDVRDL